MLCVMIIVIASLASETQALSLKRKSLCEIPSVLGLRGSEPFKFEPTNQSAGFALLVVLWSDLLIDPSTSKGLSRLT